MRIREEETSLINIGNKKALKVKYNLKGDLFGDPVLMDQITAGGSVDENWMLDHKYSFLIVQKAGITIGAVYFYYVIPNTVASIHIAVKRQYQCKYSDDVARLASRWFNKHPTITLLEITIPKKSFQAIRFAKRQRFICAVDDYEAPGDGSSGPVTVWYRSAKYKGI